MRKMIMFDTAAGEELTLILRILKNAPETPGAPDPPPEPPSWADAPEWARWRGQGERGTWHWYELRPGTWSRMFIRQGYSRISMCRTDAYNPNWRDTLQERPKSKLAHEGEGISGVSQEVEQVVRTVATGRGELDGGFLDGAIEDGLVTHNRAVLYNANRALVYPFWEPNRCEVFTLTDEGRKLFQFLIDQDNKVPDPTPLCPVCSKPASEHRDGLWCCGHCGGEAALGGKSANPWVRHVAACVDCGIAVGRHCKGDVTRDWNRRA